MKCKIKILVLILISGIVFFNLSCSDKVDDEKAENNSVSVEVPTGRLYGTLGVPENLTNMPAVLIIAGSGPTDRQGNNLYFDGDNNSLKMVSEALLENGIASLRYDKRGVGESSDALTSEAETEFKDLINDAIAWIEYLKNDVRFTKIGILGHSEGSLIGMVTAKQTNVNFFISVSGPGSPGDEIIMDQLSGQSESVIAEAQAIINELKKGNTVSDISSYFEHIFRFSVQPYLISWFKYNPTIEITKLDVPILILHGTTDIQVPPSEANILYQAKPDATFKLIEGMNHVLKEVPLDQDSNIETDSNPNLPLAPNFINELINFFRVP